MNLKLKRITRTPHSEEMAILDLDTRDQNDDAVSIGKLDLHYTEDQVVGTLLIWQEYATGFRRSHGPDAEGSMDQLIDEILTEATEPLGIPGEYGIEIYYPSLTNHAFISNFVSEDDEDEEEPNAGASSGGEEFSKEMRRYGTSS